MKHADNFKHLEEKLNPASSAQTFREQTFFFTHEKPTEHEESACPGTAATEPHQDQVQVWVQVQDRVQVQVWVQVQDRVQVSSVAAHCDFH